MKLIEIVLISGDYGNRFFYSHYMGHCLVFVINHHLLWDF